MYVILAWDGGTWQDDDKDARYILTYVAPFVSSCMGLSFGGRGGAKAVSKQRAMSGRQGGRGLESGKWKMENDGQPAQCSARWDVGSGSGDWRLREVGSVKSGRSFTILNFVVSSNLCLRLSGFVPRNCLTCERKNLQKNQT